MIDASLIPALYDLLTVAREGSVASASASLHKTPSAVSQQIRRLENAFDVALLERAGRGIRLSAAGEQVLGPLTQLFDEAEAVYALLGRLSGSTLATVRIAVSDYLGKDLLAPVMRELAEAGAPLRFEISTAHSAESVALVERGAVDIAIVSASETRHGLEERLLFSQRLFWVAPRVSEGAGAAGARWTADARAEQVSGIPGQARSAGDASDTAGARGASGPRDAPGARGASGPRDASGSRDAPGVRHAASAATTAPAAAHLRVAKSPASGRNKRAASAKTTAADITRRLQNEPLLRLAPGSLGRRVLDEYVAGCGLRPISTIDVPSVPLLLSYVAAGIGIGLAPELALRGVPSSEVVTVAADIAPVPVKLLVRAKYRSRPEVEDFLDRLVAQGRRIASELQRK